MTEVDVLLKIADTLYGIEFALFAIPSILLTFLIFKDMGGKS